MKKRVSLLLMLCCILYASAQKPAADKELYKMTVEDGVFLPRKSLDAFINDAVQFIRDHDGEYVPGSMSEDAMPGYVEHCAFNPVTGEPIREYHYPARSHALYIDAFIRLSIYTGDQEFIDRATDLAKWNIEKSTPDNYYYANMPISSWDIKYTRKVLADRNTIIPVLSALMGNSYLSLYRVTGDVQYYSAAEKIAKTMVKTQHSDGSWPFRVVPEDGKVWDSYGSGIVHAIEFLESMMQYEDLKNYRQSRDKAVKWMIEYPVKQGRWSGYHEDIGVTASHENVVAMPMTYTAKYLFQQSEDHPEYLKYAEMVISKFEETLVHTEGHPFAPAPGISEQLFCDFIMPHHTSRYCMLIANRYRINPVENDRKTIMSGINSATWAQIDNGAIMTWLMAVNEKGNYDEFDFEAYQEDLINFRGGNSWYSVQIWTLDYIIETMRTFPELVPPNTTHIMDYTQPVFAVSYQTNDLSYSSKGYSQTITKLNFLPSEVYYNSVPADSKAWSFDEKTMLLTISLDKGKVEVK